MYTANKISFFDVYCHLRLIITLFDIHFKMSSNNIQKTIACFLLFDSLKMNDFPIKSNEYSWQIKVGQFIVGLSLSTKYLTEFRTPETIMARDFDIV